MKYEVRCECGKAHAVSAADAGMSLPCGCGRRVEIPSLHELRTPGGESAIPLLVQLRNMVRNGQLPGTQDCARCHRHTGGLVRVGVGCEPTPGGPSQAQVVGCLLAPWIGWLTALFVVAGANKVREEGGGDVSIVLSLPVCEACRPSLDPPAELRKALRHIPEYAALLDHYPNARVTRAG